MSAASDRDCAFTLIAAPAGAGKTMLMTQRLEQLRSTRIPVAWLSLDAADNDPTTFWAGALATCARAVSGDVAGEAPFAELGPPSSAGDRGFFAAFVAVIEQLSGGLHLILDDVHELESEDAVAELRRLLKNAPPPLNVVLGCRHDPPLPIPRLILEGRAWEIRADDLAFDRDEARELLAAHDVSLAEPDLDRLLARTEGWAAGLRLAAMSLRNQVDASAYVASFAGDDRPVMDYLMTEVLANYPPETVSLMLATAALDVVNAELAAELSGRADAGKFLEGLARENALVHRDNSTPTSYRYHPLLRSFLLAELGRRNANAAREIRRVASDWFAARGAALTAIDHAAQAEDWGRVADILDQHGLHLLMAGDTAGRLSSALRTMPSQVYDLPTVSLIAALAALQEGQFGLGASRLDRVGRDPSVHPDARVRLLHAATVICEARMGGARDPDLLTALARVTDMDDYVDDPLYGLLATANRGMLRMQIGDPTEAENDLRATLRVARQAGWDYLAFDCLTHLAGDAAGLSDYARLAAWSGEAIAFADERGWSTSSRLLRAYVGAAWAAWQRMDAGTAAKYMSLASAIEADAEPEAKFAREVVGLIVALDSAPNRRELLGQLRSLWGNAPEGLTAAMACAFCLAEVHAALSLAEPSCADEAVRRAEAYAGQSGDVLVMRAWVHLYHGRQEVAKSALAPVLSDEVRCLVISSEITAWLLDAHIAAMTEQSFASHAAVVQAVVLAAPRRAVRDLVNATSRVRTHLVRDVGRFGAHDDFVAQVLEITRADPGGAGTVAGEALTTREMELLRELPSMLSLDEIARAHVVSVNTVKTHVKAFYRKLDDNTRRKAVERARELGLI